MWALLSSEERRTAEREREMRKKIKGCWCHGNAITCWECMKYCTCYNPTYKEDYLQKNERNNNEMDRI